MAEVRFTAARACLFDLDGTILHTLESIARAGNLMLIDLGFSPRPVDEYRFYCGDGSDNLVRRTLGVCMGQIPESALADPCADWRALTARVRVDEELVRKGSERNRFHLKEQPLYGAYRYAGMQEALVKLKNRKIRLAVCSNKPDEAAQEAVRGAYGSIFDHVQGQTADLPIKPDPAIALSAAAALGVSPSECLYFGDTWTDMRTGKAAGMFTVGVLWGYRSREELTANGADALISSPEEIPLLVAAHM